MILFLDFDGVLHPKYSSINDIFKQVPLLEGWLRLNQQVNVVISSSWRDEHPIETLREFFSDDIKPRVIDKCPKRIEVNGYYQLRFDEIMAWINLNNYTGPWLALDDAVKEFPEGFYQLVGIDELGGFYQLEQCHLDELTRKFEELKNEIHVSR